MVRRCFVPFCNSGYRSCKEKFSMFAAPKDDELLEKWRRAIPAIPKRRRALQTNDYVCEKHFEPELVCKEWTAHYKGHVLVNVPRKRVILSRDAVPTRFPDCTANLPKTPRRSTKPLVRASLVLSKKSKSSIRAPCEGSASDCQCSCESPTAVSGNPVGTAVFGPGEEQDCTGTSVKKESSVFSSLLYDIPISFLPAMSWGVHRLELGDEKSVVFSQLKPSQGLFSDPSSGSASSFTPFGAPKIVQIDEKMRVRAVFMGKCVPLEQLNYAGQLSTLDDVQSFLQYVDQIKICAGGPIALGQPQVEPGSAYIDTNHRWRHNSCSLIVHFGSVILPNVP
ncbi:uncharacterized protein LOC119401942 [Rhipicephalus sanguineus]|uniref:uncharacterized protein LOC119401942 n=1 Tax=Rhipicephalus sanguineus TaxID=34632 RepID=UPI0020C42EAD|nr:uncharacterized protein LOC119401942 [Rhipicephalus sanguineus]